MLRRLYSNSILLISINVLTVAIYFLFQPTLRKIYTPEEYGFFDLVIKIATILSAFISLKLEKLIPSEKTFLSFNSIILTTILINGTSLLVVSVPFIFFSGDYEILRFGWLICITAILISISQVLKYTAVDERNTLKFGISSLVKRTTEVITNISISKYGLILGEIIGNISTIFYLKKSNLQVTVENTKYYFIKNKKQVVFNFIPELLMAISAAIPTLLIFLKLDLSEVGLYEMTDKFISLPLVLIANPIGIILLDFFSKNESSHKKSNLLRILVINLLISVLIGLGILILVEFFVETFFETEWHQVIYLVKLMIPLLIIKIFVAPLGQMLVARRLLVTFTKLQSLRVFLLLLLFIPTYSSLSHFVKYLIISQGLFYTTMLVVIYNTITRHEGPSNL